MDSRPVSAAAAEQPDNSTTDTEQGTRLEAAIALIDQHCPQRAADMSLSELHACLTAARDVGMALHTPPAHWTSEQTLNELIKANAFLFHFMGLDRETAFKLYGALCRYITVRISALPQLERNEAEAMHSNWFEEARAISSKREAFFAVNVPRCFDQHQHTAAEALLDTFQTLGALARSCWYADGGLSGEEKRELGKDM